MLKPPAPRSRGSGGFPFAYAPFDLSGTVLWRPELVPISLTVDAAPEGSDEAKAFDPARLPHILAERLCEDGRHVVIEDAQGEHRLWLRDNTPGRKLAVLIPLDRDFRTRIASLSRFHRRLFERPPGPSPRGWSLTAYRRRRLDQMLDALDLRLGGASYREIAVGLGNKAADAMPAVEWKVSAERAYVMRLVAAATKMMNGGYRTLLRGR